MDNSLKHLKCITFMHKSAFYIWFFILLSLSACSDKPKITIIIPDDSGKLEWLAAKEIRKYIYLRSNSLPQILSYRPEKFLRAEIIISVDSMLKDQEFSLKTEREGRQKRLIIKGGSPQALLYAAYQFAEELGIRFYLHGDIIPDEKISFHLPDLDIRKKPLFVMRGILPFHDFPEGPDWWNVNDYKAVIAQLPKLKMNFIGFHTYPWRTQFNGEGPKAEPLVWIGKEDEVNDDGTVKAAYPVLHFHTGDSTWGYSPAKTSEFLSGASQLFETDNFGPDYMKNLTPWPHNDDENIRIFNETGYLLSEAFELAKMLGISTCVGTETPLIIPEPLKGLHGIKSVSEKDVKDFYQGIFTRIQQTYPIDYYWLWTPEGWTWSGVEDQTVAATEKDMQIAYEALKETGSSFSLATCGWVLGPPRDRTEFDRILPIDIPFSCINRGLGYSPVDRGFNSIQGRSKWAIPWMEDDPALLTAQLWAGRMRKDAVDSWRYGCDGLLGIHWRTRNIGPTVSALAKAAWECDTYDQNSGERDLPVTDFYTDWTLSEFGINDPGLVKIFTDIDGKGVELKEGHKGDAPLNASDWIRGPGALMVNKDTSNLRERIRRYDFIPQLESYRNKITGRGNLERFDYWVNALAFNKAVLETTLAQVELNYAVARIKKEQDESIRNKMVIEIAVPLRIVFAEKWKDMNRILLSIVSTNGELGTIANLEMHNIRKNGNLTGHDEYLKSLIKTDLPEVAFPDRKYTGETRIVVTTNQSILQHGEDFYIRIRILSESTGLSGKLFYKSLGGRKYVSTDITPIGSNVFEARISANDIPGDFEYYIEVQDESSKVLYPSTAGSINIAVITML